MAQHIGIVACSAEGAALCYRSICQGGAELLGPHDHPEISLHCHSLGEYRKCIYRDDWQGLGDLMLSSANKLAKIGADFFICPDNTFTRRCPILKSDCRKAQGAQPGNRASDRVLRPLVFPWRRLPC